MKMLMNKDQHFLNTFIITYRSFTTGIELLEQLKIRFNTPPPEGCTELEFAKFKRDVLDRIRLRITQTIKYWLENFFVYDFDAELLKELGAFIDMMKKSKAEAPANLIQSTVKRVKV